MLLEISSKPFGYTDALSNTYATVVGLAQSTPCDNNRYTLLINIAIINHIIINKTQDSTKDLEKFGHHVCDLISTQKKKVPTYITIQEQK